MLWDFILLFLCWGVWKERNDRVFRGKETNYGQLFYKIKYMVMKNIRSCGKGHQPQNAWEERVIQNWNLDVLSLAQNGTNLRDLARWDFPPQD